MSKRERIFVAGHRGMVGAALVRALRERGNAELVLRSHDELDLCDGAQVEEFFDHAAIDTVYLAAARVGGIHANHSYPAEFIHENLAIQTHVIHSAYLNGVKRLLFLGSSCIYPRDCPQPIKEEYLLTGPLEPTNRPYALAKIADHNPQIIFVDIMMPRLDGYQTCSLIKHNKVFRSIPVIMLSSKDGLFDKARGRMVGSQDYLTKPFTKDQLLQAVRQHGA